MTDASGRVAAWRELLADARLAELAAAARGVPIHLVGGAVRDAGLGRPVNDLDVVVADAGPAIAARLAATTGARLVALGGDRFGALRLVSGNRHIDIWDLQGGPLLADLWRRDFTVNAIALAVPDGAITDPTGGVDDLARRRLRATRAEVFAEDPVRVLRLARLATTLPGFDADPATVAAARAATPRLAAMPHERLRVELEILFSQSPTRAGGGLVRRSSTCQHSFSVKGQPWRTRPRRLFAPRRSSMNGEPRASRRVQRRLGTQPRWRTRHGRCTGLYLPSSFPRHTRQLRHGCATWRGAG